MTKNKIETEPELSVTRKETVQADSATYIFALGFRIMATAKGVTFGGSSTVLSPEQLKGVSRFIKRATKIHTELAAGRGLVSEDELDRKVRLRSVRGAESTSIAFYIGDDQLSVGRVKAKTLAGAVCELRSQYRATKKN